MSLLTAPVTDWTADAAFGDLAIGGGGVAAAADATCFRLDVEARVSRDSAATVLWLRFDGGDSVAGSCWRRDCRVKRFESRESFRSLFVFFPEKKIRPQNFAQLTVGRGH